jgi:ADP-heptose:LPS heptosyltransferase
LKADPSLTDTWRARYAGLGPGLKLGISWRGGHVPEIRNRRSTRLEQWAETLRIPGMHVINLQYGDTAGEIRQAEGEFDIRIHDWEDSNPLQDLDQFAAKIAALDLVVSVDNATVHMAGAVGVPVWVLQPFSPDWRWLIDREDSHWYPGLRQIRQPGADDWAAVFGQVTQELTRLAHANIC